MEGLYFSAEESWTIVSREWFKYFDLFEAFDKFLVVPHNLYSLQTSCISSYDEVQVLAVQYWNQLKDIKRLSFNLFYNGGSSIKGITNIVMYFIAEDYTRIDDAFSLGMEMGQIFWLLIYPAKDYLDNALENGAVWG